VKRAILFGASAIIILALNPKVLQEVNSDSCISSASKM